TSWAPDSFLAGQRGPEAASQVRRGPVIRVVGEAGAEQDDHPFDRRFEPTAEVVGVGERRHGGPVVRARLGDEGDDDIPFVVPVAFGVKPWKAGLEEAGEAVSVADE